MKTYAQNVREAKQQLDLITTFSKDIKMEFGIDKCSYINIEREKKKSLGVSLRLNDLQIGELENGECYKYLGQDEDVRFDNKLNKERVTAEYRKRGKKIWNSQLYSPNKILSHNIFAVPILTPTFGIIQWTKEELEQLDIKTRKLLTISGSFHKNSNIDRLYTIRKEGGRGLNSIVSTYICRTVSLNLYRKNHVVENKYLALVAHHEKQGLVRVAKELMKIFNVFSENDSPPTKLLKNEIKLNHYKAG